jgi:RNA polymerase sigma-70 factor (ECF subfamily)
MTSSAASFTMPYRVGHREQLEEWYQCYYTRIYAYLHRLCGVGEQAEDLTQETFIKASLAMARYRGDCSVQTWLFRIARNCYLDSVRRASSVRIDTDQLHAIPDNAYHGDPMRRYEASEARDAISLALSMLSERQRSILLLRDAEDLSYQEIADVLGMSLAAVKVNLFRARRTFRELYSGNDDIPAIED